MDEFIETITRTSIFAGLSREDLARVAGKLDEVRVAAGTIIIRQADPGDALYVVQTGAVEILQRDAAGDVERIAILGPRECFGEIAIFTGTPRSASVVALVDTSLLRMSKPACEQLVVQCPAFSLHICRLLGERLVERGRELASSRVGRDAVLDDLFEAQTPPIRRLLLRAAVLATPTAASLAAIMDEPPDVGALGHLAERYPRLVQTDAQGGFTFHAGLRTFLVSRLAREEGLAVGPALHARAAAHFEERQDWSRAVEHHLGARAWHDAARILERHGDALLEAEAPPRLIGHLDALPPATLRARFHLVRLRAKAHGLGGQMDAALRDCRDLLTPAHAPSLGAVAPAFGYHVGLAQVHRDKGEAAEAQRSLRAGLAVLEPSPARRIAPPALRLPRALVPRRPWTVRRRWLYALPALAAGLVVWFLPPPAPLDAGGMRFLATLTAAVVLWSLNIFDDFVVALALLLSWIVAGVVRPEVALSGFTKASWFLFVGALGLGAGVTRSGLLYRAALAMARRVTPSYPRYTAILVAAGLLATPALPSMISRMAVVAPVSWAIAESVGFAPRSPGAAGVVLAAFLGFSLLGFMFLTGSTGGLLGWNALPEPARAEFGWTAWAVAAAPAGLITIGGLWLAIHLLFRLPPDGGVRVSRERFQAQLEILGAFTRREAFGLAVLLLALVGWITTPLHGVGEAWIALGALLLFVLGGVLDRNSLRAGVDLGFLLFLGVVSSLSGVASAVNADRWLMTLVAPVLGVAAFHAVSLLLSVALVTVAVRFVLNKFAATILLALALAPLGQELGVHPGVILLVILLNLDVWFFPYQLDVYQIAYFGTGEQGFSHAQGRRFMAAKLVVSLVAVAASVPWWRALGLIR
jgi:di/tricarboxylate transporter/CRP-like cAMP-binding protein